MPALHATVARGSPPAPDVFAASYLLAALAIVLAWPVPVVLSRAAWPSRAPAAAMVLWQGVGLAGGLSMVGSFLCWGMAPLGDGLLPATVTVLDAGLHGTALPALDVMHVFALSLAALLFFHLVLTLARSAWRLHRQRERHREMLNFLASPRSGAGRRGAAVVIDHAAPMAYCLPGAGSTTVLSSGLLASLDEAEVRAVLAHEEAHLQQRHHLLLLAFTSWFAALPWLPTTRLALDAVSVLVEELADDAALKVTGREELLGALAVVAGAPAPDGAPDAAPLADAAPGTGAVPVSDGARIDPGEGSSSGASVGADTASLVTLGETLSAARLRRLLVPPPPLGWAASRGVAALGIALVVTPTVALAVSGWSV